MAKKSKFVLNSAGVVELMKSAEMKAVLEGYGSRVASTVGSGYEANTVMSGDRAKVFVHAETDEAKQDNLKNNTLLKALGSSGS